MLKQIRFSVPYPPSCRPRRLARVHRFHAGLHQRPARYFRRQRQKRTARRGPQLHFPPRLCRVLPLHLHNVLPDSVQPMCEPPPPSPPPFSPPPLASCHAASGFAIASRLSMDESECAVCGSCRSIYGLQESWLILTPGAASDNTQNCLLRNSCN
jgi:hypothetical protein